MICRIKELYPYAELICGTLMRSTLKNNDDWIFPERYGGYALEEYNHAIRKLAKKHRILLADLGALNMRYETLDGSHPTKQGHKTIADAWNMCLKALTERAQEK